MYSTLQSPQAARWKPQHDTESLSEQLALTLMESLSREIGARSPSLSSTHQPCSREMWAASNQQGYNKVSETADPQFENPAQNQAKTIEAHVLEVNRMLDHMETQKLELHNWLSNTFHSPAAPVLPARIPEQRKAQEEIPSLLTHNLSLGSSFSGDIQSAHRDVYLHSNPHRDDVYLQHVQAIQARQLNNEAKELLGNLADALHFYGAPVKYAEIPSTKSPTQTPATVTPASSPGQSFQGFAAGSDHYKHPVSRNQSFHSLSGSDDNIPMDQFFVHPTHSTIAPPPGLEHMVPQEFGPIHYGMSSSQKETQMETPKSLQSLGKARRRSRAHAKSAHMQQSSLRQ